MSAPAALFWFAAGLLLYHLAGYPLLLAVLASLWSRPVRRASFLPFISVIIPAYNEGGVIKEKILSVLNNQYSPDRLEVIVPEDGSSDDTAAQVSSISDPRVILEQTPARGGKMAALRRSVRIAKGEFLVFSDANAILQPGALASLMSNFADPEVGCACGRKTIRGDSAHGASENLYWRYESKIKALESCLGSTPAAVGELMAIRRSVFPELDQGVINDDFQIALNAVQQGYRAIYDPSAITVEKSAEKLSEEYHRKTRIAAGRWQVAGQVLRLAFHRPVFVFTFVSHKLLRLLFLPLLLLVLVGNLSAVIFPSPVGASTPALLALSGPWAYIFLALQTVIYLLALLGLALDRVGIRIKALYFLYYFLHAQVSIFGGFFRYSFRRQTVLWRKAAR